mmetsp:Transcript_43506/g.71850  ORF Transcript_43506/g.71850 Transcript_43506/m.71850 type:complete len:284 (+) Transcript_43506:1056-1907(+)
MNKLGAFFHNGQIGGKIRVEHIVKSTCAQRRNHLLGADSARIVTKFFRNRHASSRRCRHTNYFVFIAVAVQQVHDVVHRILLMNGTHWTVQRTLSALQTRGTVQRHAAKRTDLHLSAAQLIAQHMHALQLTARTHTPLTQYTFVWLKGDSIRRDIRRQFRIHALHFGFDVRLVERIHRVIIDIVTITQILQFASFVRLTRHALTTVRQSQKTQLCLNIFTHFIGIRPDFNTITDNDTARVSKFRFILGLFVSSVFDQTHSAIATDAQVRMETQRWHRDMIQTT